MHGFHGTSRIEERVNSRPHECDTTLIEAAQNGSEQAFDKLFQLYRKPIYNITYSIVRNREDAEDALQEAFFISYVKLGSFRRESQFYSWLVRIAINCALMLLRKRRRRNNDHMAGSSESYDEHAFLQNFEDKYPNPEQICLHQQRFLKTLRSIRALPRSLRTVLELRVLQEQSIGEIRNALGITNGAVKARLFRARNRLAQTRR